MLLLCFFLSVLKISHSLNGDVVRTIQMPTIVMNSSDASVVIHIDCTDEEHRNNASFPDWKKIWRMDRNEMFDASRMTFINNNASIQISPDAFVKDETFECCVHKYAYEDFVCFSTEVVVSTENGPNNPNVLENTAELTKKAEPTIIAWNVNLTNGETLFAKTGSSYFIRIFWLQIADVNCTVNDESIEDVDTNIMGPSNVNSDVVIKHFNETLHEGTFDCEGSYLKDNKTETIKRQFRVVASRDSNLHAKLLEPELAEPFLIENFSKHEYTVIPVLILFLINL